MDSRDPKAPVTRGKPWRGLLGPRHGFPALRRGYRILIGIVDALAVATLVMIGVLVLAGVAIRYFGIMQGSLSWVDQLASYLFIWLVFLGSAVALDRHQHITVDLLEKQLPRRLVRWYRVLIEALVLAVLVVLTWQGAILAAETSDVQAATLPVPVSLVYLAIPIACGVMSVRALGSLVGSLLGLPEPPQSGDGVV